MPENSSLFQDHHGFERQTLRYSRLLQTLSESGHFYIHAPENRIFMPYDRSLALNMGVSPHNGRPIRAYQVGLSDNLRRLERSGDGQAALLMGDPEALDRIAGRVNHLRDTVKTALVNGDLHTNASLGLTAEDARMKTQAFFGNARGYGEAYASQVDGIGKLGPLDQAWVAVTHNETRVVSALNYFHESGVALTRGGNIELQQHGLSLAISNAYHDGRLAMSPSGVAVVENVLGEEAARNLRVPRGQRGEVSMQLLMGEASARGLTRAGGLLATGADVVMSARTASALMEEGNITAAQSEVDHTLARNAGGWIGGASTSFALGSSSGFLPAAVVAGDALFMSKAFEKGADLKDNRAIFEQTDRSNIDWDFNGRNWGREASIDLTQDGRNNPTEGRVVASYDKSRELGAMANAKAVELALGKAPPPQDPFDLPAQPGDQVGLDNPNWHRNPDTEGWERQVKMSISGENNRGSYQLQTADADQSRRLNQESLSRIEGNIANGREAIAQAYLENRAVLRADDYGVEIPDAVKAAQAKPGQVLGHDNQLYQRNEEVGGWVGKEGVVATGNLAVELELTDQMRQPSLERSQETLAALKALPPPTADQLDRNELLYRYSAAGVNLNAQAGNLEAVELATQRTSEANGITGPTMQQLQPSEQGQYGFDSPIIHYQMGNDGVAHQVAVTTSDEIRQAKVDLSQPSLAHIPTLGSLSVRPPSPGKDKDTEPADEPIKEKPEQVPLLADNPAHADFHTYNRIHEWVKGTGNWGEEETRNVSAALYKQQAEDPLVKQVDRVTGALGKDGAHNVFAVYEPFGSNNAPSFHVHVDGREASQQPAQQSLQQAEVITQDQRQKQLDQSQNQRQDQAQKMAM